jgi:hypothetical protein
MIILSHVLLFYCAGFAQYYITVHRRSPIGYMLFLSFGIAGVYFLGWWSLLTFMIGAGFGSKVYFASVNN